MKVTGRRLREPWKQPLMVLSLAPRADCRAYIQVRDLVLPKPELAQVVITGHM